jgi:tetratricopeptide (TPR) repeat protein
MSKNTNPIVNFWQELRRRKVLSVIAMYAGAAFVIIELTNNVVEPLGFPNWIPTVIILLLIVGFPVTAVLSWLFDITPEGVKKTESLANRDENQEPIKTGRRKLRPSDIVIAVLLVAVGILVYPKIFNQDKFEGERDPDGKISVAVLPFGNLSGDSLLNVWQGGFQNLLITNLSNSDELSVRNYQAVNDVLNNTKDIDIASLSASFTSDLGHKLETRTLILGKILSAGKQIRVNAQLVDAETDEIYKTYQVDGDSEDDFFMLADSLSGMIKNYMEIKKISDQNNSLGIRGNSMTNSSEAFKHYIRGWDGFKYMELESAIAWFSKAIEVDSTFVNAYVFLAYSNLMFGRNAQAKHWCNVAYEKREDLPLKEKLTLDQLYAYFFETPHEEIKYMKQLIGLDDLNPLYWHQLAFAYYKLFEYEDAVSSWEQVLTITEKWGTNYSNPYMYFLMGDTYHQLGEHEKEADVLALGHIVFPNAIYIQQHQAICAFTQGETEKANEIIAEYKNIRQTILHCTEAMVSTGLGVIYSSAGMFDEAEDYYRQSIALEPEKLVWVRDFAWFLIDNDINIEEGLQLSENILEMYPEYWPSIDAKGWALYKQGKYEEALTLLKDSWDLRPAYVHTGYLHIQEIEQAIANQSSEL